MSESNQKRLGGYEGHLMSGGCMNTKTLHNPEWTRRTQARGRRTHRLVARLALAELRGLLVVSLSMKAAGSRVPLRHVHGVGITECPHLST